MIRFRRRRRWLPLLSMGWLTVGAAAGTAQTAPDTAAAVAGLAEFDAACHRDGGAWWGRSLCGPIVLVDPETRFAVARPEPASAGFIPRGPAWVGRLPDDAPLANTAVTWNGGRWAMVLLPLPDDRLERVALLLHESFHRIQPELGLTALDYQNPHLDERDGRYWLRLELRALARALTASDDSVGPAARDAVTFRMMRHRLYPGADTLEAGLERAEGLAEYTGIALALPVTGASLADVAARTRKGEDRPSFVRSLGYLTGPALGLLLDRLAPGWRSRVATAGFAAQLPPAVGYRPPPDLSAAAREAATRYGGTALADTEDARAAERAKRRADVEARLVRGPVVELRQPGLSRSFNPNTLAPMGPLGTLYPTGTFGAEWGAIEVRSDALVSSDYRLLRVQAPKGSIDGSAREISGPGWTLRLAPGWRLVPGPRPGDYHAEKSPDGG